MPGNRNNNVVVENATNRDRLLAFCSWMYPKKFDALKELFDTKTEEELLPVFEKMKEENPHWEWWLAVPPDITDADPVLKASQSRVPDYLKEYDSLASATKELLESVDDRHLDSTVYGKSGSTHKTPSEASVRSPHPVVASLLEPDPEPELASSSSRTKPETNHSSSPRNVTLKMDLLSPVNSPVSDVTSRLGPSPINSPTLDTSTVRHSASSRSSTPRSPSRHADFDCIPEVLSEPTDGLCTLPTPVLPLRTTTKAIVNSTSTSLRIQLLPKVSPIPDVPVEADYLSDDECIPNELESDSESTTTCDTACLLIEINGLKESLAVEREINRRLRHEGKTMLKSVRDETRNNLNVMKELNEQSDIAIFSNPTPSDSPLDSFSPNPLPILTPQRPPQLSKVVSTPKRSPPLPPTPRITTPKPPLLFGTAGAQTPVPPDMPGRKFITPIPRSTSSLDLFAPPPRRHPVPGSVIWTCSPSPHNDYGL